MNESNFRFQVAILHHALSSFDKQLKTLNELMNGLMRERMNE